MKRYSYIRNIFALVLGITYKVKSKAKGSTFIVTMNYNLEQHQWSVK